MILPALLARETTKERKECIFNIIDYILMVYVVVICSTERT
jgi:hypothetical protein